MRIARIGFVVAAVFAWAPLAQAQTAPTFAGDVAPMSLMTFDEARPWARSIKQRVAARTMPPWGADPAHGVVEYQYLRLPTSIKEDKWIQAIETQPHE